MEQKKLASKLLCIVALIFLAIVALTDFVNLFDLISKIMGGTVSYVLAPHMNRRIAESGFLGIFFGIIKAILPIVKFVILSIVLLRIIRSGIPFSGKNKKSLQWYGILTIAQAAFIFIRGTFNFSIEYPSFAIISIGAIIWFCWPDSTEENPNNILQTRITAGVFHILFVYFQIVYFVGAVYHVYLMFTYASVLTMDFFRLNMHAIELLNNYIIFLWFYNRFGHVCFNVRKGVSKFDASNIKRITSGAWIYCIGAGVVAAGSLWIRVKQLPQLLPTSTLTSLASLIRVVLFMITAIAPLAIPLAILFLALAYKRGANARVIAQNAEISNQ